MPKAKLLGRVSVGRAAEFVAKLDRPELVAMKACGWDYEYHQFPNRAFLENMLDKQGKGTTGTWSPVCPRSQDVPGTVAETVYRTHGIATCFQRVQGGKWRALLASGEWVDVAG